MGFMSMDGGRERMRGRKGGAQVDARVWRRAWREGLVRGVERGEGWERKLGRWGQDTTIWME